MPAIACWRLMRGFMRRLVMGWLMRRLMVLGWPMVAPPWFLKMPTVGPVHPTRRGVGVPRSGGYPETVYPYTVTAYQIPVPGCPDIPGARWRNNITRWGRCPQIDMNTHLGICKGRQATYSADDKEGEGAEKTFHVGSFSGDLLTVSIEQRHCLQVSGGICCRTCAKPLATEPCSLTAGKKKPRTGRGFFISRSSRAYLPCQRFRTRVALVPPKPKLLLITLFNSTFSRVLVSTGMSATSGSSSSMLAEPAMNLPSIISRQ